MADVSDVSIRDLRNHGGDVVDRAQRGERLTITRDGRPVAELRSLRRPTVGLPTVVEGVRQLPRIDPDRLRADLDDTLDSAT